MPDPSMDRRTRGAMQRALTMLDLLGPVNPYACGIAGTTLRALHRRGWIEWRGLGMAALTAAGWEALGRRRPGVKG